MDWDELYKKLYFNNILFICNELDDDLGNQLVGIMTCLYNKNPVNNITIFINSTKCSMGNDT